MKLCEATSANATGLTGACPSEEQLEAYIAGIARTDAGALSVHIAACPHCRDWLAAAAADEAVAVQLRRLGDDLKPITTPSPSIDGFRILGRLGAGGMGVVFEAQQLHPPRRVAIKVVRAARWASRDQVHRLQREAEALGRLRHPAIAAIHEAGVTDDGHDYVVMERVEGIRLDQWALRARLHGASDGLGRDGLADKADQRRVLRVFARICEAVHYAHEQGVIHRDIKPSNILVERGDQPKVLDFGLAKVLTIEDTGSSPETADLAPLTETVAFQGTPAYMSPEQLRGPHVDARSDVYALGVVLYELLTGRLPHSVRKMTPDQVVRTVNGRPPTAPSVVCRTVGTEFDAIIMKALEKEPARRYDSAAALAADIERYLACRPVHARPASVAYRTRKCIARNRAAFTVAGLIFGLISGFAAWMAVLYRDAAQLHASTLSAQQAESRERQAAQLEAERAHRLRLFFESALRSVSPAQMQGEALTARSLPDAAARQLESVHLADDELESMVRHVIGASYSAVGCWREAEQQLRRAVELRTQQSGEHHPETLSVTHDLVIALMRRPDLSRTNCAAEVEQLARQTHDRCAALRGAEDVRTLACAHTLATVLRERGRRDQAIELLQHTLPVQQRVLGESHLDTLQSLHTLGDLYRLKRQPRRAEPLLRQAMELCTTHLGQTHPLTLAAMRDLGTLLSRVKDPEGIELCQEALRLCRDVLGESHPQTHVTLNRLCRVYRAAGRIDEAEALLREVVELTAQAGDASRSAIVARAQLAGLLTESGRLDEAVDWQKQVVEQHRALYGEATAGASQAARTLARLESQRDALDPDD